MSTPDSTTAAALTLALEAFMDTLESMPAEEAWEIIDAVHTAAGPSLSDQSAAAAAETMRSAPRVTGPGAPATQPVPSTAVPRWARLGALNALAGWATRTARTCMHHPDPDRPQPIVATAWRPGLIACTACLHLLDTADAVSDATCDGCGRVCAGPEVGDGIRPASVVIGPLTFRAGICGGCYSDWPRQEKTA